MLRTRALILGVSVLFAALFAVGCGSDSDDTTSTASAGVEATENGNGGNGSDATSEATVNGSNASNANETFVKEAEAICFAAQEKAISETGANLFTKTTTALEAELEGIGALTVPSGDEPAVEAILDSIRQTLVAIEAGGPKNVDAATARLRRAEKLVTDYGLKACLLPS